VPDKPYRPKPSIDSAIGGFMALALASGWVILRGRSSAADPVLRRDGDRARVAGRNG